MISNLFSITDEIDLVTLHDFTEWALRRRAVNSAGEVMPLILMISSPGGEIAPTLDMAHLVLQLRDEGLEVITFAAGVALSASVALLAVGSPGRRYAAPYVMLLFHEGTRPTSNDDNDKEIVALQRAWVRQDDIFNNFLTSHCNLTLEEIKAKSMACTSFGAAEAVKWGLADHVGWPPLELFALTAPPAGE